MACGLSGTTKMRAVDEGRWYGQRGLLGFALPPSPSLAFSLVFPSMCAVVIAEWLGCEGGGVVLFPRQMMGWFIPECSLGWMDIRMGVVPEQRYFLGSSGWG